MTIAWRSWFVFNKHSGITKFIHTPLQTPFAVLRGEHLRQRGVVMDDKYTHGYTVMSRPAREAVISLILRQAVALAAPPQKVWLEGEVITLVDPETFRTCMSLYGGSKTPEELLAHIMTVLHNDGPMMPQPYEFVDVSDGGENCRVWIRRRKTRPHRRR